MQPISTPDAPAAIGPYAQAIIAGDFLFSSGQLGVNPATGNLVADDTATQTEQIFKNIAAILAASGLTLADVVKTTVFVASLGDFKTVNEIYGGYFGYHKPARSTVQVAALPLGAKIEIECIAALRD